METSKESAAQKKKNEEWMKAYEYLQFLRYGPSSEERELQAILRSFTDFLVQSLFITVLAGLPKERRDKYLVDLRMAWKRQLRMNLDEQVKRHESMIQGGSGHLVEFLGDGENVRLAINKQIVTAEGEVDKMFKTVTEKLDDRDKNPM